MWTTIGIVLGSIATLLVLGALAVVGILWVLSTSYGSNGNWWR